MFETYSLKGKAVPYVSFMRRRPRQPRSRAGVPAVREKTVVEQRKIVYQLIDGLTRLFSRTAVKPNESAGGKFGKDFMPTFLARLDEMIATQQHSVWWENILYSMVGTDQPVYVDEMDGLFWAEVDYVEDYERILKFRGFKADFSLHVEKA